MFCQNCGSLCEETEQNCPCCGAPLQPEVPEAIAGGDKTDQPSPEGGVATAVCAPPVYEVVPSYAPQEGLSPQPVKKRKIWIPLVAAVSALVLLLTVLTYCFLFQPRGLWAELSAASQKSFGDHHGFDFNMQCRVSLKDDVGGGTGFEKQSSLIKAKGQCAYDVEQQLLTMAGSMSSEYMNEVKTTSFTLSDGQWTAFGGKQDVQEQLDKFFQGFDEQHSRSGMPLTPLQWQLALGEDAYKALDGMGLRFDQLSGCLTEVGMHFLDEKWLQQYCGYEKKQEGDTTQYVLTLTFGDEYTQQLLDELMQTMSPAMSQSLYKQVDGAMDVLRELSEKMRKKYRNYRQRLVFSVENEQLTAIETSGNLVSVPMVLMAQNNVNGYYTPLMDLSFSMHFSNFVKDYQAVA